MNYQVLLYYKYASLPDARQLVDLHKAFLAERNMKGRVIIAEEGINGTVEGGEDECREYQEFIKADPRLSDIVFKVSAGTGSDFPKLSVKFRSEIVSTHIPDPTLGPLGVTGKYLSADELHQWFETGKEFYIVDMRNDYEHISGHFENSIFAPFANFRDLPAVLDGIAHLKDKTIVTVCTGGVRCEKASGFLVKNGFTDVYQLKDGIVTYMELYPNQHFLGKLYVFDGRILMGFNTDSPDYKMVGKCQACGKPSENYINCANLECHKHLIICTECVGKGHIYCGGGSCAHLKDTLINSANLLI